MISVVAKKAQRGVALVVALLFLLVVTVISVIAASNSTIGLKMSANLQGSYASFQSAEAGIIAVLSLAGTANDPFDGDDTPDPFAAFDPAVDHPLRGLSDGADSVDTDVYLTTAATACHTATAVPNNSDRATNTVVTVSPFRNSTQPSTETRIAIRPYSRRIPEVFCRA